MGSSPRGRGKLCPRAGGQDVRGLIPARAGKTSDTQGPPAPPSAHPRAGGENPHHLGTRVKKEGSSPRGRGKPFQAALMPSILRLIPARAGKT